MGPEQVQPAELTAEQQEMADFLIVQCGLEAYADANLEMMGETGTVRYGLGRCAHHFIDSTPAEIKLSVLAKLEQQTAEPKS